MDPFEKAMSEANAHRKVAESKRAQIAADADKRAKDLAHKVYDAIVAALSGYPSLGQPTGTLRESGPGYEVLVEASGPGGVEVTARTLEVTARTLVQWTPGDGVNIGRGEANKIRFTVRRGFNREASFFYEIGDGLLHVGRAAVDKGSIERQIIEALERMP